MKTNINKLLAANLKRYRMRCELTQNEVAIRVGCTTASYCRYENGDREVPVSILIKLADLYHVSMDTLVRRESMSYTDINLVWHENEHENESFGFVSFEYITGANLAAVANRPDDKDYNTAKMTADADGRGSKSTAASKVSKGAADGRRNKSPVNLSLALSTANKRVIACTKKCYQYADCFSVNDAHRMVKYLDGIRKKERKYCQKCKGGKGDLDSCGIDSSVDTLTLCKIFSVSRSGYYHFEKNGDVVKQKNRYVAELIKGYLYSMPGADKATNKASDKAVDRLDTDDRRKCDAYGSSYMLAERTRIQSYLTQLDEYPELKTISTERIGRIMDWYGIEPTRFKAKKTAVIADVLERYKQSCGGYNICCADVRGVGDDGCVDDRSAGTYSIYDHSVAGAQEIADDHSGRKSNSWNLDIAEISTGEGKLYLCLLLADTYVIGYSIARELSRELVVSAINRGLVNWFNKMWCGDIDNDIHSLDPGIGEVYSGADEIGEVGSGNSRFWKPRIEQCENDESLPLIFGLKCEYLERYKGAYSSSDVSSSFGNSYGGSSASINTSGSNLAQLAGMVTRYVEYYNEVKVHPGTGEIPIERFKQG